MILNERPESVYEVETASRRVERQLDKVDDEIYYGREKVVIIDKVDRRKERTYKRL